MTLRRKILVIISLMLAALLVALYLSAQAILLPSFAQLGAQYARQNVTMIVDILADEIKRVNQINGDWAPWDDTYAYMQGKYDGYIDNNLYDDVFVNLNLNLMLFVQPSGEIVYGKGFDLAAGKEMPVPAGLLDQLAADDLILHHDDPEDSLSGILMLPEGPLLFSARPIVTTNYEGPIVGTLIMGRFLNTEHLAQLVHLGQVTLTYYRADDPGMPPAVQAAEARLSDQEPVLIQPLGDESMAGYALLKDVYGQPALILQVDVPRQIYQFSRSTIGYFLLWFMGAGLVLSVVSLVLLDRFVLTRLTYLSRDVNRIGAGGDLSTRLGLGGQDELAGMATTINRMLDRLAGAYGDLTAEHERTSLLYAISAALGAKLDLDAIMTTAVELADRLGATVGELYLVGDSGEAYFKSTDPGRSHLSEAARQALARSVLAAEPATQVLEQQEPRLVTAGAQAALDGEVDDSPAPLRSGMIAPIAVAQGRLRGVLAFMHPVPDHFGEADLALLRAITTQVTTAFENSWLLNDIQRSLRETHLMLDISRQLSAALNLSDVYAALIQSVMATGAERCTLHMCDDLDPNNIPRASEVVLVGDINPVTRSHGVGYRFTLAEYPLLADLTASQETLVIEDITADNRLTETEQAYLQEYGAHSCVINPLVSHGQVVGLIAIDYRVAHTFTERELALYRTLCNQTTIAIENARQVQRTEQALAETQTLYRAGRVLAGAADLQDLLEEALVEFLYSLGLDQGGITLLSMDGKYGQLMAYMQDGQLQDIQTLRFTIREDSVYQQMLMSGQPFVSYNVAEDPRLADFLSFNPAMTPKSLLEAPMIIRGETIGWIGADAVKQARNFTQQEIDMARAMADQIAITIQNRRLLEQTERRAEQLKTVAQVGETVAGLIELDDIFNKTVELIRDRFGFYSVSIFLLDDAREWAAIRASAGEACRELLTDGYRIKVGSHDPVGQVTDTGRACIALKGGEEAFLFDNPYLPETRSEMAAPVLARGSVIGALDVQSSEVNAFSDEDVETLQIMADQLATAIENARLFDRIQRQLQEQAMLYRIGTRIGSTLNVQESADILVTETAEALKVAECALSLIQEDVTTVIAAAVDPFAPFPNRRGRRARLADSPVLTRVTTTQQEAVLYAEDSRATGPELAYTRAHRGTVAVIVPILLRSQVIGFLEVYDHRFGRRFKPEDLALLDSIALLAASAIENARLFTSAQESQAFMKAIINQIPDPIFIKDREHRWVVVNQAASDMMNMAEDELIGRTDYDYSPKEEADWFWEQDDKVFKTGQVNETEEQHTDRLGTVRTLYTRKIPFTLGQEGGKPRFLITMIQDITEAKQRADERERLLEEVRRNLERTSFLYRISDTLAATTELRPTFERVLGEYLGLLKLTSGSVLLFNQARGAHRVEALYLDGQPADPNLILTADSDFVAQYMRDQSDPVVIEELAILLVPFMLHGQLAGGLVIDGQGKQRAFSPSDVEAGEAIAGQLSIWLENHQLLAEAQYRSTRLQTAAEVSRAASSILDVDELIATSVNLIRDQFNFYYVGLFLVDEARKFAVLRAGTGEAGRIQVANGHRLEIGGNSMIGWSVANRKARIALDVGQEAVRFQNKYLPDTHSEMALPLVSRDEVIGALTVQSTERGAFSDEDITLLQTMADHLANAIENARLFVWTQQSLAETENLYRVTQELLSAHTEEDVYQVAIEAVAGSGADSGSIYIYLDSPDEGGRAESMVEQKAAWAGDGHVPVANGTRFSLAEMPVDQFVPTQGHLLIDDVAAYEPMAPWLRQVFTGAGIQSLLILPLMTAQSRLGFLLVAYRGPGRSFSRSQIRFYTTVAQQMVVALENLRLVATLQRRARREEIIREISGKIRSSISIDDILKTTVTELGKVLGSSRGNITLTAGSASPVTNGKTESSKGAKNDGQ